MSKVYFRIKNFDKFQHYKDKNPGWIKLHNRLLNDMEFNSMTDSQQLTLIKLWMVSSQNGNRLVYDSQLIRKQLGSNSRISLDFFVKAGWIEMIEVTAKKSIQKLAPNIYKEDKEYKEEKDIRLADKKPPAKRTLNFTDYDLEMAKNMRQDILAIRAEYKFKGTLDGEAHIIRKMRKIDNRGVMDINRVWDWAIHDGFWGKNIRSPASLRKKFDRLCEEMEEARASPHPKQETTFQRKRAVVDEFAKSELGAGHELIEKKL